MVLHFWNILGAYLTLWRRWLNFPVRISGFHKSQPQPLPFLHDTAPPTMANYLASIFGTEQDKVNCSFYYKIGACRHGDRCSRKHVKPSYSQTILLPNLYQNPAYDPKNKMNPQQMQMHFDAFYEDIWCELCQYGLVEEVVVCDNNNDRKCSFRFAYSSCAFAVLPLSCRDATDC